MATAGSSPRRAAPRRASERHRRRVLHRDGDDPLQDVLSSANATGLHRDLAAVQTALDLPWTTNPAEGQINRLKMITRTMYGRAGSRSSAPTFATACAALGAEYRHTRSRTPQMNGMVERFNGRIGSEVLGITIWSPRDLEQLLRGFNAA